MQTGHGLDIVEATAQILLFIKDQINTRCNGMTQIYTALTILHLQIIVTGV